MKKLQGIAVSPGVAVGEAFVLGTEGFRIPQHFVLEEAVDGEIRRLNNAIRIAESEIRMNRDSVARELGSKYADIFEAHLQILSDPKLHEEFKELISSRMFSAEHAVSVVVRRYAEIFRRLDSSYLAERIQDIHDIEKRLLRLLLGIQREGLQTLTAPVQLLASNLTPSETANLKREFVQGFATELGGPGGHTAIFAAALGIPAIVGVGPFLTDVSGGDVVIIDGDAGVVILQPDEETLQQYHDQVAKKAIFSAQLEELRDEQAITKDGTQIHLLGNIEFPQEVESCRASGAEGVGLYRTEFLYLVSATKHVPTEEDHYEAYKQVLEAYKDSEVTIRTCDLGADKMPNFAKPNDERNPFLGLRSIRLSLRNTSMFRQQLKAVLRASVHGKARLMFPLVTTLMEFRQAKSILADVREEMDEDGIPYDYGMPVGMMVEVPAAVVLIDRFAEEVDFFSIGTNDLIQYALAVDRSNKDVSNLYNAEDPVIMRLIRRTISVADEHKVPVSLCGQMSSNPLYTMLLIGLGLRTFSCTPAVIPQIKKVIRSIDLPTCRELAETVLERDDTREIRMILKQRLHDCVPEISAR
ncbi:MAG: phosphoenolpyruvate--protein phosphotransferase [Thermoguttaceae bacterium]